MVFLQSLDGHQLPDGCNGDHTNTRLADDATTTNNWSQGLDLRSTLRRDDGRSPQTSSSARILPPATAASPVKMEVDENKGPRLPLKLDAVGCATRIEHVAKADYVAQWCKDQREFTQNNGVNGKVDFRKPKDGKLDENKDSRLPLNLDAGGCATRTEPVIKADYVAEWCKDQSEFTHNNGVNGKVDFRKPKDGKLSTHDKFIKRFTHPFTKKDKKTLDDVIGQIANNPTRATLPDVQHSDFVQGRLYVGH